MTELLKSDNQEIYSVNLVSFVDGDVEHFRNWLKLDEETITWQGRFQDEFELFWENVFSLPLSIESVCFRINYLIDRASEGPIVTWLSWFKQQLLAFTFIHKEVSIRELSKLADIDSKNLATLLRNFFADQDPLEIDSFDSFFEAGFSLSKNLDQKFSHLIKEVPSISAEITSGADSLMDSIEVTLYSEWDSIMDKLRKELDESDILENPIRGRFNGRKIAIFLKDVVLQVALVGLIIVAIQQGNVIYEKYLSDQVKIFEPSFLWLDKSLSFKDTTSQQQSKKEILNEISELEAIIESQSQVKVTREERFETESDVQISSIGNISSRLNIDASDTSKYEESRKGVGFNFRGYRYGRNRVYRLMVKSVTPEDTKRRFAELLRRYNIQQADNVIPGTEVPGGLYYNLFVPRKFLGEFLFQISDLEEATLYETKTRGGNPKDMNKVFIFVKKI